jgi:hypothetical protein
MLLLNLDTERALESVDELLPVFALVAASSPSAYVRGAIFQLMTVSTCTSATFYLLVLILQQLRLLQLCYYCSALSITKMLIAIKNCSELLLKLATVVVFGKQRYCH